MPIATLTGTSDALVFLAGHGTIGIGDPDSDGELKDNGLLLNTASCAAGTDVLWDGELRVSRRRR